MNSTGGGLQFGHLSSESIPSSSTVPESRSAKDWLKILTNNQVLSYVEPIVLDGEEVAKPYPNVFDYGEVKWSRAIVGQFYGKVPNFSSFLRIANTLWAAKAKLRLVYMALLFFVI